MSNDELIARAEAALKAARDLYEARAPADQWGRHVETAITETQEEPAE